MDKTKEFIDREFENILLFAKKIASIPSPTFFEKDKGRFIKEQLEAIGLQGVQIDEVGNVIVGFKGLSSREIIFSAHMDTVFPISAHLEQKEDEKHIFCPGICDNAIGVSSLFFLSKYIFMHKLPLRCPLTLVFNVCEEELGNLKGIRHFFGHREIKNVAGHICIEGHQIGRLTTKAVGNVRLSIRIKAEGGHSWRDFGNPNAVVLAAALIMELMKIEIPQTPKTTLHTGIFSGGTSINSIPSEAAFSVEVRSSIQGIIDSLCKKITDVIGGFNSKGCEVLLSKLGERPCGATTDKGFINIVRDAQKMAGIEPEEDMGSTDSNYPMSKGIPSITIGITKGSKTHTDKEYLEKEPIRKGFQQLISIAEAFEAG